MEEMKLKRKESKAEAIKPFWLYCRKFDTFSNIKVESKLVCEAVICQAAQF